MREDESKEGTLMAKPIEATPVLKGQDLLEFAKSLQKKDSNQSKEKRKSALSLVQRISK